MINKLDEMMTVANWINFQYPKTKALTVFDNVLFVAHSDGLHHGLWLEMKDRDEKSQMQHEWTQAMIEAGYYGNRAAGAEEAIRIIADYMNGYYQDGRQ